MRYLVALALVIGMLLSVPSAASASTVCRGGTWTTEDLAGLYVSQPNQMVVQVQPCGMVDIVWYNAYGRHQATYLATTRYQGGEIVAAGIVNGGAFLDDSHTMGIKPAEPGFIQVVTAGAYFGPRVYRLEKIR